MAEALQTIVGHQAIGIFIPAIDGFTQILESVIGMVGGHCNTSERIPYREAFALPLGAVLLFDHVAEQVASLGIGMVVGHRGPELLQGTLCVRMLRSQSTKIGLESLPRCSPLLHNGPPCSALWQDCCRPSARWGAQVQESEPSSQEFRAAIFPPPGPSLNGVSARLDLVINVYGFSGPRTRN